MPFSGAIELNDEPLVPAATVFYTDGSLIDELLGEGIYSEEPSVNRAISLSAYSTFFEVELYAIASSGLAALKKKVRGRALCLLQQSGCD